MANKHTLYLVKADMLDDVPAGIRKLVNDFFEPIDICGIDYLINTGGTDHIEAWERSDGKSAFSYEYMEDIVNSYDDPIGYNSAFDWLKEHPKIYFEYDSQC